MREKDAVGIVTLNLTCMTTNHIIILQWHILEFMRKCLTLTFKEVKQHKIVDTESRVYWTMANFGDYPGDFIL